MEVASSIKTKPPIPTSLDAPNSDIKKIYQRKKSSVIVTKKGEITTDLLQKCATKKEKENSG